VMLVDACHSMGMVRSSAQPQRSERIRYGGFRELQATRIYRGLTREDEGQPLSHVTTITAVEADNKFVTEILINDKWHGALSWYFAQALNGEADGNQNGYLERSELNQFLQEKVHQKMNYLQTPQVIPAQETSVLKLPPDATFALPSHYASHFPDIALTKKNVNIPKGLKNIRYVNLSQDIDLRLVNQNGSTEVFNNTGDKVTTLQSHSVAYWQRLIDKERLLKALKNQFDMRYKPIFICLKEGNGLHHKGKRLNFIIEPGDQKEGLNALTLFNLAGNGELQFLYPLPSYKHNPLLSSFPYTYTSEITEPYGGDNLIIILCKQPLTNLHTLLLENKPDIPKLESILAHLRNNTCQVGQYAFFSGE